MKTSCSVADFLSWPERNVARHEIEAAIKDFISAGAHLLRRHGRMVLVYPAARAVELWSVMSSTQIEPHRVRFVQSFSDTNATLVLAASTGRTRRSGCDWWWSHSVSGVLMQVSMRMGELMRLPLGCHAQTSVDGKDTMSLPTVLSQLWSGVQVLFVLVGAFLLGIAIWILFQFPFLLLHLFP